MPCVALYFLIITPYRTSPGRLFFQRAEVFSTFCVKKYSKNDNKKNIQQQVKGKFCFRIHD